MAITLAMRTTKQESLNIALFYPLMVILKSFFSFFQNLSEFCNLSTSVLPQVVPLFFGDEEVNLDETVTATCTITKGDLPMNIWWTFSDSYETEKNLTTNDGIEILRRGQKVSMLSIEAVKARHRGNYTCHAHNKAGIALQSAQLAINGDRFEKNLKNFAICVAEIFSRRN